MYWVLDQLVIWFITFNHQLVLIGPAIGQYVVEETGWYTPMVLMVIA
jgi:hypothetical protein